MARATVTTRSFGSTGFVMKSYDADADRADGGLEASLPGDDDDGHVRSGAEDALAELEAAHLGHRQVGEDEVEVLEPDELERPAAPRCWS